MVIVTVAALLVAAAALLAASITAHTARTSLRAHERERARLIDQVCHLAGRPWGLTPRDLSTPAPLMTEPDDEFGLIEV